MLNRMRHTSLLLLGCVLAITGCGGGPSEAEIDATVEARMELAKEYIMGSKMLTGSMLLGGLTIKQARSS